MENTVNFKLLPNSFNKLGRNNTTLMVLFLRPGVRKENHQPRYTGLSNQPAHSHNSINTANTYILYSIETSHSAWVTVYDTDDNRDLDSTRTVTTDPLPGSGVLAEVVTSGAATQLITPGTICFNNESTPNGLSYLKVENLSGGTADITVTLKFLALEG